MFRFQTGKQPKVLSSQHILLDSATIQTAIEFVSIEKSILNLAWRDDIECGAKSQVLTSYFFSLQVSGVKWTSYETQDGGTSVRTHARHKPRDACVRERSTVLGLPDFVMVPPG
jgi:hypothetical protein